MVAKANSYLQLHHIFIVTESRCHEIVSHTYPSAASAGPINHRNEFLLITKSLKLCENIVPKVEI